MRPENMQGHPKRLNHRRAPPYPPRTVTMVLEQLGYTFIGRATRAYFVEDQSVKSEIYHINPQAVVDYYGEWQGYE